MSLPTPTIDPTEPTLEGEPDLETMLEKENKPTVRQIGRLIENFNDSPFYTAWDYETKQHLFNFFYNLSKDEVSDLIDASGGGYGNRNPANWGMFTSLLEKAQWPEYLKLMNK